MSSQVQVNETTERRKVLYNPPERLFNVAPEKSRSEGKIRLCLHRRSVETLVPARGGGVMRFDRCKKCHKLRNGKWYKKP
jgi:hypothetical protein